jgi:HPt (histidine-containing phosphotransfer) domain-containing protein
MKLELECRLDPQVLTEVAGSSTDFARELLNLFVADSSSRVDALSAALRARDRSSLRTEAYGLKGSAIAVGACRLSTICHLLEEQATETGDPDAATVLVDAIRAELSALVTMLGRDERGAAQEESRLYGSEN